MITPIDALARAKSDLIRTQPFFASLICSIPMTPDASVETMETDGRSVKYSPNFVSSLTGPELLFVLAHETLHIVYKHSTRRNGRNPERWNIAADYLINQILSDEKIGKMPASGLYDPDLVARGNATTEGIYALLPDSPESGTPNAPGKPDSSPGTPGPGKPLDKVVDAGADASEIADADAEITAAISAAANVARMSGKLPGALKGLIAENAKPRVDWKSVLRDFLTRRAPLETSFARPKKRFLADDLILPSLNGQNPGHFVLALDMSGSISDEILSVFAREARGIHEDMRPETLTVIYFDSKVSHTDTFSPDDTLTVTRHGGGGTDFAPVMAHVRTLSDVAAIVILTDLDCSSFGEAPDAPVLWVSTLRDRAPYGQIVPMKGI